MEMTLQPGRELDAKVAEVVMDKHYKLNFSTTEPFFNGPYFSTSWEAMRLVVERMRELGWMISIDSVDCGAAWSVIMNNQPRFSRVEGSTLPHAVCLAALAAIEGERK